jgi:hypothetical protein
MAGGRLARKQDACEALHPAKPPWSDFSRKSSALWGSQQASAAGISLHTGSGAPELNLDDIVHRTLRGAPHTLV